MRPGTLVRLASVGSRADALRVALTALSATLATLAVLTAATVLAIPELAGPLAGTAANNTTYRSALLNEPGLRPGVVIALMLLTIPVLALAGQCGRLGAPARDRRLAAVRLAGATPGQTVSLTAAETGLASTPGVGIGFAAYLVGRRVLDRPNQDGRLPLPTDVLPPWPALLAIALGLPLVAALTAALVLRRVRVTPFGVVHRQRLPAPRPWPAFLIVPGVACFAVLRPLLRYAERHRLDVPEGAFIALLFAGALAALVGLLLGTGWISHVAGRVLHRVARRPAALLAGRRLIADPWASSRVFAAVLACVLFGGGAAGMRAYFATEADTRRAYDQWWTVQQGFRYTPGGDDSSLRDMDLVYAAVLVGLTIATLGLLVGLAEGIVTRRRTYAALVASGVPRGVLARSMFWQTLTPAVPAVLVALAVGVTMTWSLTIEASTGGQVGTLPGGPTAVAPELTRGVPIPFADLGLFAGGTILAIVAMTGLALLFLRPSVSTEELRTT
ncbi:MULTISPECIES: FtsX-like permease family protein [unclassified Pseudofrankia]|uniref:FtsX-like permease family protein n=1 Tax=unclassified Pseudofrankia TaxID=2994372 RepID=UPI0008DA2616|nr:MULTISPECIES: FtsX-like permease family protein [unclassified Pseudofrankia]MDT3440069.1 ABC transporter permease [Pseudofrankia sp. BMG5.37]OHV44692.1 hypothetical protein BCD48_24690 [Pseudofrankia sp. BMG5.36]